MLIYNNNNNNNLTIKKNNFFNWKYILPMKSSNITQGPKLCRISKIIH